jgi:hypothetical protein
MFIQLKRKHSNGRSAQPAGLLSPSPIATKAPTPTLGFAVERIGPDHLKPIKSSEAKLRSLGKSPHLIQLAKRDSDCFMLDFKISGKPPKYNTSILGLS